METLFLFNGIKPESLPVLTLEIITNDLFGLNPGTSLKRGCGSECQGINNATGIKHSAFVCYDILTLSKASGEKGDIGMKRMPLAS